MPQGNDTTTKFKVDISELKKGIQEANRQIRLANAEFKAAASGMDDWQNSTDGLNAKIKQLETVLDGENKKLSSLKEQLALVEKEQGANSKGADELRIAIANQQAAVNKTEKALNGFKTKLSEAENSTGDLNDELRDTKGANKEAADGFTVFKGALANLAAEGIKKVTAALGELTKELVTDSANAYAQFAAATGTAADAMGDYEEAIQNVYKNNFGESLADVAEKMTKVKEVTGELDASKLQAMTEKAITLEDTFGMDMTETLRGVNSLMDHFGMSSEEAFDLMASGAQNGLNYTDELGDNVSEYAGKFAEAGFSSAEYFQLLKNGADGGAYNLDKVNDSVNEITTRLADGTIEDSLDMFDKDTQTVFKEWKKGKATQKDVIAAIVKNIKGTTNEQEKMNLAAKAFGTMAEDGGTQFIEALTPVGETFDNVKGKADELAAVKYDTPTAAISGIGRTLKVELLQPMVDELTPALNSVAAWVSENLPAFIEKVKEIANTLKEYVPIITGIGAAIATYFVATKIMAFVKAIKSGELALKAMAIAQKALNLVMNMNPIGIVIAAIAGLVAAFVTLWNKSEAFRNFWLNLWEKIKSVVSSGVKSITEFFTNLWGSITGKFGQLGAWFKGKVIQPVVGFFGGMWDNVKNGASKAWEGIKSVFSKVGSFFSDIFGKAWAGVIKVFSVGGEIFTDIKNGILDGFKWIVNKLIKGINKVVAIPFKGINAVLKKIKNIELFGSKPFSDMISTIDIPEIPELRRGGVLAKGQTGYLEGDGAEAVVPLENNKKWIGKTAKDLKRSLENEGLLMGRGGSSAQTVNNNYNFTQNNTSPKALSRLEIYRQTKNQLAFAKGV